MDRPRAAPDPFPRDAREGHSVSSPATCYLPKAIILAVLVTAVGWWPAGAWMGASGQYALLAAAGICLVGAVIARLAAKALEGLDPSPDAGARGIQAGIAVRLLATLAMSLPVFVWEPVPGMPFAAFLGAHYLAHMVLEVFVSVRELSQNHGPTRVSARESQPEGNASQEVGSPPTGPESEDATSTSSGA